MTPRSWAMQHADSAIVAYIARRGAPESLILLDPGSGSTTAAQFVAHSSSQARKQQLLEAAAAGDQ